MEKSKNKIKRLQQSILHAKMHIKYMNKQRNRSINHCDQILEKSIPKLKALIQRSILQKSLATQQQSPVSHQHERTVSSRSTSRFTQNNLFLRESHIDQSQVSKKFDLQNIKIRNALDLREITKRNEDMIRQKRQQQLEEKKKKKLQLRQRQIKSKENIKTFHNEKVRQIKQMKQLEKNQYDNHAMQLEMQFKSLQDKYKYATVARMQAKQNVSVFQKTLGCLKKVKPHKIYEISSRFGVVPDDQLKKKDVRNFLQQLNSNITNKQEID